jgi:hypothetical protein
MHEKHVTVGCLVAWVLWVSAFGLILTGAVTWIAWGNDDHGCALMSFGMAFSAGAATATIRTFFATQNRLLRDAFELGREAGPTVRRLPRERV